MPSTLFDSAGLAIVAYAQVDGVDGSQNIPTGLNTSASGLANSGIYTTRLGKGTYLVQLSSAIGQDPARDLIFVQPTCSGYLAYPPGTAVLEKDDYSKIVEIGTFTTALDCDFNVLVLRTILP